MDELGSRKEGRTLIAVFASIAVLAAVDPGAASEEQPKPPDIVVTGERVTRTLRDTPASAVVATARTIDEYAAPDRIEQVLDLIPNVQISSGGEGPTIRGLDTTGPARDLPAFLGGTQPRTTLVVDGRPVSFNEFIFGVAPIWDLERIEVFRSPQTTTQGRNSISGAVFVHTNDPGWTPEYRARAISGSLRTRQLSAVASSPIVADQLALRIAADYRFSRPSSDIADAAVGASPDRDEFGLLRFKLLATPAGLPGSRIELNYTHSRSQMPQIEGIRPPFKERRDPVGFYGTFRTRIDSGTTSIRYQPRPDFTLNALVTAGKTAIQRFAPEGLGETRIRGRDWSAESILAWSPEGPLQVTGGLSHSQANLRQYIDLSALSGEGRFRDRQTATGIFGEATWSLFDKAKLSAGLRYQRDRKERSGALGSGLSAVDLDFDRSFDAWLPKLSFAYDFNPSFRAGVLVQRAYNPGGTSLRFDTGQPDNFEAETLWDYELFARASLAGGSLKASANLFYYDMRDAQRAEPIIIRAPSGSPITFADLFNIPKARSSGLEALVEWTVSDRLSVRAGIGLLRTRITHSPDHPLFEDKQFQRAPRFSASASLSWRPVNKLLVSGQLRHNSRYFSDDLNDPVRRIDGWSRLDGKVSWDTGRLNIFAYGRNLLDDFHMTYLFNPSLGTAGDPREVGVGLEARF